MFPDALDVNDDYPFSLSFISKAAVQCALLGYGQHKAHIQLIEFTLSKATIRRLDLTWKSRNNLTVMLSPDLNVLVVDGEVFHIAAPEDSEASNSFTL